MIRPFSKAMPADTIYQSIGFGTRDYVPLEQKAAQAQREITPCKTIPTKQHLIILWGLFYGFNPFLL